MGVSISINTALDFSYTKYLSDFLKAQGMYPDFIGLTTVSISLVVLLFFSFLLHVITKKIILSSISKVIKKSHSKWDDVLLDRKVFDKFAQLVPVMVLYVFIPQVFYDYTTLTLLLLSLTEICLIFICVLIANSAVNAFSDIYSTVPMSRELPIKGFIQVAKIIFIFIGGVLIVAIIAGKSPVYLLSGLGALTAVLMLIFKDAILGFVAGIQLASNRMVSVGDWIEMPKFGADGDVVDIALTTVKVQNWDNTVTTIPTYALISDSFKNWRYMSESGGRRIKRSVYIDLQSVKFCSEEMLTRFSKVTYIADYITNKQQELEKHNLAHDIDYKALANGRRLTNIGTFRAYLVAYLKNHPMINQDLTLIVRQLTPTEHGLPIEIYVFCKDKQWDNYESIQADIFDHVFAVMSEFDLNVYQVPSGTDIHSLKIQHE